ncbi:MAG TPA: PTS sugar transporter subunit IIA [Planctomycetota bacterium]|nr:PTS sugar transporter subunit IIA [Planctomycetota bacterium]
MKLSELLVEPAVLHGLEGLDKWAVIAELTDRLVGTAQIPPGLRDLVCDSLVAREKAMSTGMEHGVAIPHASVAQLERPAVSMGIAPAGVDFQAIDGRPTQLVILVVNPANRTKEHIRTLAEIARLLSSREMRDALVASGSGARALEIIRQAEAVVT